MKVYVRSASAVSNLRKSPPLAMRRFYPPEQVRADKAQKRSSGVASERVDVGGVSSSGPTRIGLERVGAPPTVGPVTVMLVSGPTVGGAPSSGRPGSYGRPGPPTQPESGDWLQRRVGFGAVSDEIYDKAAGGPEVDSPPRGEVIMSRSGENMIMIKDRQQREEQSGARSNDFVRGTASAADNLPEVVSLRERLLFKKQQALDEARQARAQTNKELVSSPKTSKSSGVITLGDDEQVSFLTPKIYSPLKTQPYPLSASEQEPNVLDDNRWGAPASKFSGGGSSSSSSSSGEAPGEGGDYSSDSAIEYTSLAERALVAPRQTHAGDGNGPI